MDNPVIHNDENQLMKLQKNIESLESRVKILEQRLNIKSMGKTPEMEPQTEAPNETMADWEEVTGASQLGWLAIIVSLIGLGFFIRMAFNLDWITGWGQPITLAFVGSIIMIVSDRLWTKNFRKFSSILTVSGYITLNLALYWAAIHLKLTSEHSILFGSILIWILSIAWGFRRKSSLWPLWSFLGAGILPLFILKSQFFGDYFVVYCNMLIAVTIAASIVKEWYLFPAAGTLIGHLMLLITVRYFFETSLNSINLTLGMISTIPALLILWGGLIHIYNKRKAKVLEIVIWGINIIFLYAGIINLWGKLKAPYLLIVPVACNAFLYIMNKKHIPDRKNNLPYLIGLVVSAGISLTVIIPEPFDIISLCLFALFLAYQGDKKQVWDYKALSGVLLIWSLVFLFTMRFGFSMKGEIPFVNFRFISFGIAFLCFGYQGKMINSDPSAGKMGPLLGQGLFSIGLLVLLSGIASEFIHLFPHEESRLFSEQTLLSLTIVIAVFSFMVTYIGLALRLFYIRLLALALFLILVSKMIFLDIIILRPSFLISSMIIVALLLGGTSMLLRKSMTKKRNEAQGSNNNN